jgi:hypothetical protein
MRCPELAQLRLQDPSTTTMEGLLEFNKHVLFVITVVILVGWLLFATISNYDEFNTQRVKFFPLKRFRNCLDFTSFNFIKFSFTFVYITLLYMDEITPEISVKIIGHQWF